MRKPVIAGNWKLFKTSEEAVDFVNSLLPLVNDINVVEIVLAPVFTVLSTVKKFVEGSGISIAAQDCFWEDEGAYTGEVSPKMLVDAGCTHVIIGHSERRQFFFETDDTINRKLKAALKGGLTAILCIGETLSEREAGETFAVLEKQITGGLSGILNEDFDHVIIAYEPVWAIGTGKTATEDQAQEAHLFIRNQISRLFGGNISDKLRILYGGSVKPENIKGLMSMPDIDGALVGGASLNARSFAAIIRYNE
ncbi:MAG TPA: triose-phosphate isomerase [Geobacteraceae bacterium]|nr:triose-phosphate isomerase [Geobacteraceae bacterium]